MGVLPPRLKKDTEDIVNKFGELIQAAATLHDVGREESQSPNFEKLVLFRELRASALNLLGRIASPDSVYYRELAEAHFTDHLALRGILQAALNDYRQGYVADNTLLVSAEVFADFLVQAEVLLENDYKDAAAVIIRAVLEDGLRRLCHAGGLAPHPRDGIDDLANKLVRKNMITALQKKEIDAKRELGNHAAHGRFGEYTKADVVAFLEFVQRFLANLVV